MFSLTEQIRDDVSSFRAAAPGFHSKCNLDVRLAFGIVIFGVFAQTLYEVTLLKADSNEEDSVP